MEAKDTVMNPNDATKMLDESFGKIGEDGIDYCGFDIEPLLEAQAEISFKAGIREVVEKLEAWRAQGTHLVSDEAIQAIKELGK